MTRPDIIAHRGGALLWPENSLTAFRGALALPVDEVECDIHPSSDGVPMVIHDATLDRTTRASGPVARRSAAELAATPLRDAPGEGVPRLADLAALLAATSHRLRVEVKADADGRPYPGLLEAALGVLDAAGLRARSVVIAFDGPTAARAAASGGLAGTVWLLSRRVLSRLGPAGVVAEALALGVPEVDCALRDATPALLATVRQAGLRFGVWGADRPAEIARALALGVDALATDDPLSALRLRDR
ncbi:MAG: glycerophosphodiester phosphodiesterase [Acetobacteraceae bacterium]|nr:glycerophosphodiester phosphodiesterase [Acetobacteraceae bacterium]MDW8398088.1 glycerophosphodiester phosphodiesterase family protein [Acetobacteraceae bacterium]